MIFARADSMPKPPKRKRGRPKKRGRPRKAGGFGRRWNEAACNRMVDHYVKRGDLEL